MMRHHKPSRHSPPHAAASVSDRLFKARQYRMWANAFRHVRPSAAKAWARKADQLEKGLKDAS
jgi:hypothetical protein